MPTAESFTVALRQRGKYRTTILKCNRGTGGIPQKLLKKYSLTEFWRNLEVKLTSFNDDFHSFFAATHGQNTGVRVVGHTS